MSKDYLGCVTADHKALDDVALVTGFVELLLSCEASLVAADEPIGRHVKIINAHYRHAMVPSGVSAARFTQATAHKAFPTPVPEG